MADIRAEGEEYLACNCLAHAYINVSKPHTDFLFDKQDMSLFKQLEAQIWTSKIMEILKHLPGQAAGFHQLRSSAMQKRLSKGLSLDRKGKFASGKLCFGILDFIQYVCHVCNELNSVQHSTKVSRERLVTLTKGCFANRVNILPQRTTVIVKTDHEVSILPGELRAIPILSNALHVPDATGPGSRDYKRSVKITGGSIKRAVRIKRLRLQGTVFICPVLCRTCSTEPRITFCIDGFKTLVMVK